MTQGWAPDHVRCEGLEHWAWTLSRVQWTGDSSHAALCLSLPRENRPPERVGMKVKEERRILSSGPCPLPQ